MSDIQIFAVCAVFVFILLDIISGFSSACATKSISSQAMREGFIHKFAIILLLAIAIILNYAQEFISLGIEIPMIEVSCTYLIVMELASILENIAKMNPELLNNPLFILLDSSVDKSDLKGEHIKK